MAVPILNTAVIQGNPMTKASKIIVLSTKGGAGKSTVCIQVIAPYMYQKNKTPIKLYEFDDENQESRLLGGSEIIEAERIVVGKKDLRDELTDILLNEHNACIDVGANKTAITLMDALLESGMIYRVDLVVIPLMDGEIDAMNAFEVYCALKAKHPELKVLFALVRTNNARELSCQFDLFLGDKRGLFSKEGVIESLQEEDKCYFLLPDTDTVKNSRLFGMSIWELGTMEKNITDELKEAIEMGKDAKSIKLLSFKKALKHDCEVYVKKALMPAFNIIAKRLGEKDD
jgi:hypothetical protein